MRGTWLGCIGGMTIALGGCGLTLDLSPPDPQTMDGGGRFDAGLDGGARCRTDLDCDDGDLCSGVELCEAGRCVRGEPVVCPVEDRCEASLACEPTTGECTREVAAPICPEGDACTGIGFCDRSVGCTFGPPMRCDDGVACTRDSCEGGECRHEKDDSFCDEAPGGECDEEDDCQYETCSNDSCRALNPCQMAACDGNRCVRTRRICPDGGSCCAGECVPAGCDDGDVCTDDYCDDARGCQHEVHARGCDDGDLCTISDRCVDGSCRGLPRCPVGTNSCVRPTCDPASGACGTVDNDEAPCSNGDRCTTGDRCRGGTCRAGTPVDCDDTNPCTVGMCTAATGCTATLVEEGTTCSSPVGTGSRMGACSDGVCVFPTTCRLGTNDCDGDGECECVGPCTVLGCVGTCEADVDCGLGTCCLNAASSQYKTCIPIGAVCPGGCCFGIAD